MNFLERLHQRYHTIIASDLSSQILKLASDIIDLEYDESTEKDLLSTLEKVYDFVKHGTTADINWQQNIIKNRENKERLKEERAERNKRAQQFYKNEMPFEKKLKDKVAQEKKKQIANNIKQLDNVIQVDFKKAKQKKVE